MSKLGGTKVRTSSRYERLIFNSNSGPGKLSSKTMDFDMRVKEKQQQLVSEMYKPTLNFIPPNNFEAVILREARILA